MGAAEEQLIGQAVMRAAEKISERQGDGTLFAAMTEGVFAVATEYGMVTVRVSLRDSRLNDREDTQHG